MTRLTLMCAVVSLCACTASNNPICGDGVREDLEECDDGDNLDGDGCSATCDIEPFCGDGTTDAGEECDDGNNTNGDNCSATCVIEPYCGDGNVDPQEACDDGNNNPSDGCSATCGVEVTYATTANWSFKLIATNATVPCPVGAETAAVHSQPLKLDDSPAGPELIDLYNCSAGTGTTAPLFEGRYRTYIAFTNNAGTTTYATTLSTVLDLRTANKTLTTSIAVDGGYFGVSWNLVGATSNAALTCADVTGENGVELVSTLAGPNTIVSDIWDCEPGSGITAALLAGTYTVSLAILDQADASLGTAPAQSNKQIQAPNKLTDLGTITIPVDGL